MTRGHLPKSDFLNFSSCRRLLVYSGICEYRTTYHLCQTPSRDNVSCVHEAVQVSRRLLYLLPHVIVAVEVEDVGDEVERVLVVLDFGIEAGKVEAIREIFFVDLAEVLVAARRYKLYQTLARLHSRREPWFRVQQLD
jgi:hypothetical protein